MVDALLRSLGWEKKTGFGLFTAREFENGEVIGPYTDRVFNASDAVVQESDWLVAIPAARHGAVATNGHVVVSSD